MGDGLKFIAEHLVEEILPRLKILHDLSVVVGKVAIPDIFEIIETRTNDSILNGLRAAYGSHGIEGRRGSFVGFAIVPDKARERRHESALEGMLEFKPSAQIGARTWRCTIEGFGKGGNESEFGFVFALDGGHRLKRQVFGVFFGDIVEDIEAKSCGARWVLEDGFLESQKRVGICGVLGNGFVEHDLRFGPDFFGKGFFEFVVGEVYFDGVGRVVACDKRRGLKSQNFIAVDESVAESRGLFVGIGIEDLQGLERESAFGGVFGIVENAGNGFECLGIL